jgi:hypothetical protein
MVIDRPPRLSALGGRCQGALHLVENIVTRSSMSLKKRKVYLQVLMHERVIAAECRHS